jgi:transcriptional regulator with XRE-family HTH domain
MPRPLREVLAENVQRFMDAHPDIRGRQESLEARSGKGQTTVSRVMRQGGGATLDTLEGLAKGLDVPAWVLLFDANSPEALADLARRLLK